MNDEVMREVREIIRRADIAAGRTPRRSVATNTALVMVLVSALGILLGLLASWLWP